MKQVPDDHWVYDEGASITFIAPSLGPGALISRPREALEVAEGAAGEARPNAIATRLLEALHEARRDEEAMSGDEVPDVIELEDGEAVEWVASTYADEQLINLFVCRAEGEPEAVLATKQSDGGVVQSVDGPWGSVEAAKASYGRVPEGVVGLVRGATAVLENSPRRPRRQHGDGQHWVRTIRLSGSTITSGLEKSRGSIRGSCRGYQASDVALLIGRAAPACPCTPPLRGFDFHPLPPKRAHPRATTDRPQSP